MENSNSNEIIIYIVVGTLVMLFLVVTIILFVILAQRKSNKQQLKMQEMKNQHQKDIFKSVMATQEKERKRIAKNLHDEIGTSLSAAGLMLSQIFDTETVENQTTINTIKSIIDEVVNETRRIVNDLLPSAIEKFGLFAELNDLSKLIENSAKISLIIQSNIKKDARLSSELELTLYRVIKEFCNNTLKYAKASTISLSIHLSNNEYIKVQIEDNGVGFNFDTIKKNGHGLKNMESRVYLMGGKSELTSKIGAGTRLKIELPLTKQDLEKLNRTI